ncbi:MAG: hypothetical protein LPJ91_00990 [Pseudazoarcus pumilus]|nr:hypothetical protein [Pseudazoarcus pumilus]
MAFLLYFTWPISELSLNKSGVFGDSFGALTALFSGLAFSGMIVTVTLQRNELSLQRKELKENRAEFARSASAQETNSKLSALTALLVEYKSQLAQHDKYSQEALAFGSSSIESLQAEEEELIRRKNVVLKEIEAILASMGVQFET